MRTAGDSSKWHGQVVVESSETLQAEPGPQPDSGHATITSFLHEIRVFMRGWLAWGTGQHPAVRDAGMGGMRT